MNYALRKLYDEDKFCNYEAFFLLTNDSEFENKKIIKLLLEYFDSHKRLAILSPCSKSWGEKKNNTKNGIRYFWFFYTITFYLSEENL